MLSCCWLCTETFMGWVDPRVGSGQRFLNNFVCWKIYPLTVIQTCPHQLSPAISNSHHLSLPYSLSPFSSLLWFYSHSSFSSWSSFAHKWGWKLNSINRLSMSRSNTTTFIRLARYHAKLHHNLTSSFQVIGISLKVKSWGQMSSKSNHF